MGRRISSLPLLLLATSTPPTPCSTSPATEPSGMPCQCSGILFHRLSFLGRGAGGRQEGGPDARQGTRRQRTEHARCQCASPMRSAADEWRGELTGFPLVFDPQGDAIASSGGAYDGDKPRPEQSSEKIEEEVSALCQQASPRDHQSALPHLLLQKPVDMGKSAASSKPSQNAEKAQQNRPSAGASTNPAPSGGSTVRRGNSH